MSALAAFAVAGCGVLLATPGGEARVGAAAAEEIERSVGLVEAPALEAYVDEIGQRLASGPRVRDGLTFEFRIADMIEPNAFALPGGYIYVSRGLLVLLNDEDELANVLGHEIAHVSARHHLKHALRQTPFVPVRLATGIAGAAVYLAAWPLGRLGAPARAGGAAVAGLGQAPGSLYLASHGRSQENEADEIGQQLASEAGWDAAGMSSAMAALARNIRLHGEDPEKRHFLDTHPTTPERDRRTLERAQTLVRAERPPIAPDRAHFFANLDGLLVGEPASDGVVADQEFLHADLDLRLAFPEGWKIENGVNNVTASPPDDEEGKEVFASLTIAAEGDDPEDIARQVLAKSTLRVEGELTTGSVGSLRFARAEGRDREGGTTYQVVAHWIAYGELVYQVLGAAPEASWARHGAALSAVAQSFRPLTAQDRERVVEQRLRVALAQRGESFGALIERRAGAWNVAAAAAANGLAEDAVFEAEQPVKLALWERYSPER
jgi:predicted Zn-dependent protease